VRSVAIAALGALLACAPAVPNTTPLIQKNRVQPVPEPDGVIAARCSGGNVDLRFEIHVVDPDVDDTTYVFWYVDHVTDSAAIQSRPFAQERVAAGSVVRDPAMVYLPVSSLPDVSPTSTHLVEVLVSDDDETGPQGRYVDYLAGGSFDAYPWVIEIADGSCQ
jgi:hypothetical protein